MYRTGGDAEHPIVQYEYNPDRKVENAKRFLAGFSGWLHANGYQGYHEQLPQSDIAGIELIRDTKLESIETVHGNVDFLQMIGVNNSDWKK